MRHTAASDKSPFQDLPLFKPRSASALPSLEWDEQRGAQELVIKGNVLTQAGEGCHTLTGFMVHTLPTRHKYTIDLMYWNRECGCHDAFGFCNAAGASTLSAANREEGAGAEDGLRGTIGQTAGCVSVCFSHTRCSCCHDMRAMRDRGIKINGTVIQPDPGTSHATLMTELGPDEGVGRLFQLRCDPQAGQFECFVDGKRRFGMTLPEGPLVLAATLCGHDHSHDDDDDPDSNSWEVSRCFYGHPSD